MPAPLRQPHRILRRGRRPVLAVHLVHRLRRYPGALGDLLPAPADLVVGEVPGVLLLRRNPTDTARQPGGCFITASDRRSAGPRGEGVRMKSVVAQDQRAQSVAYRTVEIDGTSVFYREAGDSTNPKLLLLGGFPASSHQFRNLIPALAHRFHVLALDYPGFGNTELPDDFEYSFKRLSEIVEGLLEQIGFHPFGLYVQDYGGPIGNRIVARRPSWLEWQVIQNANAYDEGFTAVWDGIRELWLDRNPETEAPLHSFLELEGVKLLYLHGHRDPERISPDNWNMDLHFLERPGARKAQLDLLHDYRTNVELYPQWQAFFREHTPPTLILWGENDIIFAPEGALAYLGDLPEAELHLLDSGHFAVEDSLDAIAEHIERFHAEKVVGSGGAQAAEPEGSTR
jgi:pimeloyl-ACP methyl ester carboxylesterase